MFRFSRSTAACFACWISLAGCACECVNGGGTNVNQIGIVAGDSQVAFVGTAVFIHPTVSVGVSGITVSFEVTGGSGSVSESRLITRYDGTASVDWILGPVPGANTLMARILGSSEQPAIFWATGLAKAAVFNPATAGSDSLGGAR